MIPTNKKSRAKYLAKLLEEDYAEVRTPLNHKNEFELLVATMLSTQTLDTTTNKVTPNLFKKYPDVQKLSKADPLEIEPIIRTVNYHKTKSRNLVKMANILLEKFGGKVPKTITELIELPGVGRKIANVVINEWFRINEGFVVDTHVLRVAKRFGLTESTNPKVVEQDLMMLFPKKEWDKISLRMIFHGRELSQSRNPKYINNQKWSKVYKELNKLHVGNRVIFNLYYEGNFDHPEHPVEDSYANSESNFVVADGVTHDLLKNGAYPNPSEAGIVADLISKNLVENVNINSEKEIQNAFAKASGEVKKFNSKSTLYKNREKNSYNYGAAVVSGVFFNKNFSELTYAVLDDCSVKIFRKNKSQLKPYALNLIPHVLNSAEVALLAEEAPYNWDEEGRKFWRKNIRNHKLELNGKDIGYGAIDGREGYEQFLQVGKVKVQKGDLILVYTDGFEKVVDDSKFIELISKSNSSDLHERIEKFLRKNGHNKEKTMYLIQITDI